MIAVIIYGGVFMIDIAVLGEVMLEFSLISEKNYTLGISGDTYNSACTLTGLDINVTYITSLGEGRPAEFIRQDAQHRGVRILEPETTLQKSAGLYMINNDEAGERFFNYWREDSAAKALFSNKHLLFPLLKKIIKHDYIYFSGITLSLINESCRPMFIQFLKDYRNIGGKVIFDPNYRPKLWFNQTNAVEAISEILPHVDIYLPGYEEEEILFGCASPNDATKRLLAIGISEVVIKNGSKSCLVICRSCVNCIEITPSTDIEDTTGAGDTFNGGYIGARLKGLTPSDAVSFASKAASQILSIKGGVLPVSQLFMLNQNLTEIIQNQQN
jgi:2-dehydro-3-deoxygluconokinase